MKGRFFRGVSVKVLKRRKHRWRVPRLSCSLVQKDTYDITDLFVRKGKNIRRFWIPEADPDAILYFAPIVPVSYRPAIFQHRQVEKYLLKRFKDNFWFVARPGSLKSLIIHTMTIGRKWGALKVTWCDLWILEKKKELSLQTGVFLTIWWLWLKPLVVSLWHLNK